MGGEPVAYLANGSGVIRIAQQRDLNTLAQTHQLVSHIACPTHASMLDEVFVTPLHTVVRLNPLVVYLDSTCQPNTAVITVTASPYVE